ncbi:MAG TPA: serine/threonine-protein kinase [Polyangiaceae bacterium]|nr:serine/threonine-protein kinase [Polyangiaceae bacterium]
MYPDDAGFCPVDGVGLLRSTDVPVAATDEDPRVGSLLCMRYQVRRVVADGGMGRVYEALDMQDKSRAAIKVLHGDVSRDTIAVERFKREFEVSALLPHDHIVEVKDFRETDDKSYALVMEFLEGEELRTVLKREKRIPPERLVRMMSQTAIGLDEAHRRQLVHRDLKPDNLFLCGTRQGDIVKVLDFGSVKDKSSMAKKLTVIGTTIGSPFYMAPEQAQGLDTLDARADVWALAAIAYECLTGSVPFQGINGPSILLSILTKDPIPPTQAGKDSVVPIPASIDDLMEVALAKNPNIRTRTVGELADALGRAYGLSGDHLAWAYTPQEVLGHTIQVELPKMLSQKSALAVDAMADPFGAPTPPPPLGTGGSLHPMDRAFQAASPSMGADDFVMGVPKGPPKWLVPAIIGAVAVVLGVAGAVLFLR